MVEFDTGLYSGLIGVYEGGGVLSLEERGTEEKAMFGRQKVIEGGFKKSDRENTLQRLEKVNKINKTFTA